MALGVAGSELHRKVCKGGDFWQDAVALQCAEFRRAPAVRLPALLRWSSRL